VRQERRAAAWAGEPFQIFLDQGNQFPQLRFLHGRMRTQGAACRITRVRSPLPSPPGWFQDAGGLLRSGPSAPLVLPDRPLRRDPVLPDAAGVVLGARGVCGGTLVTGGHEKEDPVSEDLALRAGPGGKLRRLGHRSDQVRYALRRDHAGK
jgi:hypothetical protein